MRIQSVIITVCTAITLGSMALQAANTGTSTSTKPVRGNRPPHTLPADLAAYDKDGDGVLNEEERAALKAAMEAKHQAFVDKYDSNKDGVLSEEELAVAKADREAARKAERTARFTAIDTDGDGKVTLAELKTALTDSTEARVTALFKSLDANADDSISLEEFLAKPAGAPGKHGKR